MMTDEEYIASEGQLCPFCDSNNIYILENTIVSESDNRIVQQVECPDCNNVWEEKYDLTGFST